jgi:hypothetical protein
MKRADGIGGQFKIRKTGLGQKKTRSGSEQIRIR